MFSSRKAAALTAAIAMVVPVAAVTAQTSLPAQASAETESVSIVAAAQSYITVSSVQGQDIVRDDFEVNYTPPVVEETAEAAPASVDDVSFAPAPQSYSGENVVAYADQFIGVVPYGWGADPSDSFSCDGLVQYVFAQFGIWLPRGADSQAAMGTVISASEAQAGDLVWWPGQHVGIYDGNGGMVNSPDWGRYVEHVGGLWGSPVFVRL